MFVMCKKVSLRDNGFLILFLRDNKKRKSEGEDSWWSYLLDNAFKYVSEKTVYIKLFTYFGSGRRFRAKTFYVTEEAAVLHEANNLETIKNIKGEKVLNKILKKFG